MARQHLAFRSGQTLGDSLHLASELVRLGVNSVVLALAGGAFDAIAGELPVELRHAHTVFVAIG